MSKLTVTLGGPCDRPMIGVELMQKLILSQVENCSCTGHARIVAEGGGRCMHMARQPSRYIVKGYSFAGHGCALGTMARVVDSSHACLC
jgi:hypothetical protein